MHAFVRVCKVHGYPTTRHCNYAEPFEDKMKSMCLSVFCKKCIIDRMELMTNELKTEMGHMMCNRHWYEFLKDEKKYNLEVLMHLSSPLDRQLEFSPGNYATYLENQIVTADTNTSSEPLAICSVASARPMNIVPSQVTTIVDTSSSLVNSQYASATFEALKLCVTEEYLIPETLTNVPPKKHRAGAKNNAFLHNFFGMCLWSHINEGVCWMTGADFRNTTKIQILHENTELFRVTHPELFTQLMTKKGLKLEPKKMFSFCANQRVYHRQGIWDKDSHDCKGLYQKQYELLEMVSFPWE